MKRISAALFTAVLLIVGFAYAADTAPSTWITNYTYAANSVSITNTTFTANGATTNDLNATTGDIREVTKAVLEELYGTQTTLAGTTNAVAYMSLAKKQTLNSSGQITTVFTVTFVSDIGTSSITSE